LDWTTLEKIIFRETAIIYIKEIIDFKMLQAIEQIDMATVSLLFLFVWL